VIAACISATAFFTASAAHSESAISLARRLSAFLSTESVTTFGTTFSALSNAISAPVLSFG
jgi:NhaP-type Na+/H+ or K+/H+ antiporter